MKLMSDAVFAEMQQQVERIFTLYNEAMRENSRLTDQIIELKRDGFARPAPAVVVEQKKAPDLHPSIMAAIRTMAPEGSRLEGELAQYAEAALLAEQEPEDIADMILAGSTLGDD